MTPHAFPRFRSLAVVIAACLLSSVLLAGCGESDDELGVVAKVNGQPIRLGRLQARYDLLYLGFSESVAPTVEKLRVEYGRLLAGLLVEELARQEMEKRGIAVSEKELEEAEAIIRADYPEGSFEEMLSEEYIDIKAWRDQLQVRLSMEKFFAEVLRPKVKLDYQEVMAYFKEHAEDFARPARIRLLRIQGGGEAQVRQALTTLRRDHSSRPESVAVPGVEIKEMRLRQDSLPPEWATALKGLSPGDASPVFSGKTGWMSLVYLESVPAEVLSPAQAYPQAEQALLEFKLHEAFEVWLSGVLKDASIKVNVALRERLREEDHAADTPLGVVNETTVGPKS